MTKDQVIQGAYVLSIAAAFFAINFSLNLGLIYAVFILGIALSAIFDKNIQFPVYRKDGWLKSILWGIGGYVIFTLLITLFLQGVLHIQGGFMDVINSSIPPLAHLAIFTWLSFGVFIPIVESIAFPRLFEVIGDTAKSDFKFSSASTWFAIILTSFLFAIFHLASKGLTNYYALIIVGLMMVWSLVLVLITKDMRAALFFHVIANTLAILSRFEALPSFLIMSLIPLQIKFKEKSLIKSIK